MIAKNRDRKADWNPGQAEKWAGYLCKKSACALIQIELPSRFQLKFENDYREFFGVQNNFPSAISRDSNYFIQENKRGREYRIYFTYGEKDFSYYEKILTLPKRIQTRTGLNKNKTKRRRINSIAFVNQMFKLGFRLGEYNYEKDFERIKSRISKEMLSSFEDGFRM